MDTNKLPEGLLLNKTYSVGACLGEGGFGITYLGFDVNLEKKVAIKEFFLSGYCDRIAGTYEVVPKDGVKGQTFYREKARFVEEARILAKIDEHPGIVKVLTYFEENGTAYIIMEFIEGRSLKSYVIERGGWLPVTETLELMEPIIKALAAVHDKGIVHRDISPDNIMLTASGRVKLIDFGAAKSKEMDLNSNRVFKKSYSPIEQCERDGEIGTYSDIYAICATIYQIITGTKPPSALERKKEDTLMPPSAFGIDISPVCDAAIVNGLAFNHEERIKNATDLYYFLYVYGKDSTGTPEGVKKKIDESSTKVIIEKMQKENIRRKNKQRTVIMLIIITVLACGIILVRQIGKIINSKDTPVSITNEDGEKDEKITAEDLEECRDELYAYINEERSKEGMGEVTVSSTLETVCNSSVKKIIEYSSTSTEDWNNHIRACVTSEMSDSGIGNASWLVLPYTLDFSVEQAYEDITINIESINGGIEGALDLMNCSKIGISMGINSDGTIFLVLIFK